MKANYHDILSRISEPPHWFDEEAVPRFIPFDPDQAANIYATEAVLLKIECQSCGRPFEVCMTNSGYGQTLSEAVVAKSIHYGDPPNIECCHAGPTMNSEPIKVLQFWLRVGCDWTRVPELEIDVEDKERNL
jgi:hypothetical protein